MNKKTLPTLNDYDLAVPSPKLILASQSPRRRQLLESAGYEFSIILADDSAEPEISDSDAPDELVIRSSFLKAKNVADKITDGLILAADTVAECHGVILGKPRDRDHAREMLELMSGQVHQVLTGVTLWLKPANRHKSFLERTTLKMDQFPPDELENYLNSDGWVGKAGAFGYQDGLSWIHIVDGSANNVVGLPVERLSEWIGELDVDELHT